MINLVVHYGPFFFMTLTRLVGCLDYKYKSRLIWIFDYEGQDFERFQCKRDRLKERVLWLVIWRVHHSSLTSNGLAV